jgi:hypothetical protein
MPYQLMYSSQAAQPMTVEGLEEILVDARGGNEARNVTGALVHVDGVFFQILEGDKDVVKGLMRSIARDTRHHSVKVFYEGEVDARAFQSWRMAYLSASAEQMSQWAGLPGTVSVKELLGSIDREGVPRILVSILKSIA